MLQWTACSQRSPWSLSWLRPAILDAASCDLNSIPSTTRWRPRGRYWELHQVTLWGRQLVGHMVGPTRGMRWGGRVDIRYSPNPLLQQFILRSSGLWVFPPKARSIRQPLTRSPNAGWKNYHTSEAFFVSYRIEFTPVLSLPQRYSCEMSIFSYVKCPHDHPSTSSLEVERIDGGTTGWAIPMPILGQKHEKNASENDGNILNSAFLILLSWKDAEAERAGEAFTNSSLDERLSEHHIPPMIYVRRGCCTWISGGFLNLFVAHGIVHRRIDDVGIRYVRRGCCTCIVGGFLNVFVAHGIVHTGINYRNSTWAYFCPCADQ